MSRDLPLLVGIGIYFLSSLGGVSIVKLLNYHYCFTSWWIFALLSRSTWVLSAILHIILQSGEQIRLQVSKRQVGIYLLVAVGLSLVEVVNSFSMSILPGSLYMLLKGSDVGWSMALSYLILHKTYSATKIVAATLILVGIGTVFLWDFVIGTSSASEEGPAGKTAAEHPISSMSAAALLCLGGAFLNSLCSVGTEAMLKQTLQEEQDRLLLQQSSGNAPSKLLLSNAYSMWTSFFAFGLLVVPVSLLEHHHDDSVEESEHLSILNNANNSCPVYLQDTTANARGDVETPSVVLAFPIMIGLLLALLGVSRFLERLCKHFICVYDSAVTFSIVQAARRWLGIYIVGLVFQEGFAKGMIVGSLISGVGFLLHSQGQQESSKQQQQHAYKKVASELHLDQKGGLAADPTEEIELSSYSPREGF